jgi:putative ABC transport system permease protein
MPLIDLIQQAARMAARDWRAGELRLLAAALVIAVAAVTSVGFLVDRIRIGLERDATQLLGADAVLSSDRPIGEAWRSRACSWLRQSPSPAWSSARRTLMPPRWRR